MGSIDSIDQIYIASKVVNKSECTVIQYVNHTQNLLQVRGSSRLPLHYYANSIFAL